MTEQLSDLAALVAQTDPEDLAALVEDLPPDTVTALLSQLGVDPNSAPPSPMAQAVEVDEGYRERPHLSYASQRIARAVQDVEDGRSRRLIIEMPPRMGKTFLVTQLSALWILQRHPRWHIALTSHDGSLAAQWGRQVRRWVEQGKAGSVQVAPDAGAVKEWETTEGGGVLSRSIRESFTGRGARVLFVDDPHKDFADAHSAVSREAVWNWWLTVAQTRLEPPSLVIVIACMTGDTPVLRPDGTETPLRDIRPGDEIATYEDGALATSRVVNWVNQGPDDIFTIRMKSGRTVRANARHPFLTISAEGEEEWLRTDQLAPGSKVLSAVAPGRASSAQRTDATDPSVARGSVPRTTTGTAGRRGIDRPRSISIRDGQQESSIDTGSVPTITTLSSSDRRVSAPSAAKSLMVAEAPRTGPGSSASTTTTRPARFEGSSATTATSSSSDTSHPNDSGQPLGTWSVIADEVYSVEPAGREDVYDLQVERTENFIANGLVSHNTRWHEDDLIGRLLSADHEGDPADWERIRFPAIAEADDALGREPGEPLLSPLYDETIDGARARWAETRSSVGEYAWSALMQQHPAPARGAIFDMDRWRYWTTNPALADGAHDDPDARVVLLDPETDLDSARWIDSWDMAFKGADTSDFVVGQRWAQRGARRYLIDQTRGRRTFTQTLSEMRRWHTGGISPQRVHERYVEDKANGPAIIDALREEITGIKPVKIKPGDGKEVRARAITPEIESGHVYLPHPSEFPWVRDLLSELRNFPHDSQDDQVDALTQALSSLRTVGSSSVTVPRGYVPGNRAASSLTQRRVGRPGAGSGAYRRG